MSKMGRPYVAFGRGIAMAAALVGLCLGAGVALASDWKAPADADSYTNPVKATPKSVAAGEKVFKEYCMLCHGEQGKGDGPTSKTLPVKPANLADKALISGQSDGALAWKILTGRGPMPSWAPVLEEQQIWDVVNYIRSLSR